MPSHSVGMATRLGLVDELVMERDVRTVKGLWGVQAESEVDSLRTILVTGEVLTVPERP